MEFYLEQKSNRWLPVRTYLESLPKFPALQRSFRTMESFGAADIQQILGPGSEEQAIKTFEKVGVMILENRDNKFIPRPLPGFTQQAPVWKIAIVDWNNDGWEDLYLSRRTESIPFYLKKSDIHTQDVIAENQQGAGWKEIRLSQKVQLTRSTHQATTSNRSEK